MGKRKIIFLIVSLLGIGAIGVIAGLSIKRSVDDKRIAIERKTLVVDNEWWQRGVIQLDDKYYQYKDDNICYLVMGIDSLNPVEPVDNWLMGGQADALYLLIADPTDKKVSILALNRNTVVDIETYTPDHKYNGTLRSRLCIQHGFGDGVELSNELQVKAVSKVLDGLPINGYIAVNKGCVGQINNVLGGVEVQVLEDIMPGTEGNRLLEGETVHLNDDEALYYTTWRDMDKDGGMELRTQRQMQYIKAAYNQVFAGDKNKLLLLLDIYNVCKDYIMTDIDVVECVNALMNYEIQVDPMYRIEGMERHGIGGFLEFYPFKPSQRKVLLSLFYKEVSEEEIISEKETE